jgi:hypothetical protein
VSTTLDDMRVADLTVEQLEHLLANRRARVQYAGPTAADEERHLVDAARATRIARAMVVEDGFPGPMVVQAVVTEYPRHAEVIARTVAEALAEASS